MKKVLKKALLVLLSLCVIVSFTACEEKEEIHDEAWYAKQIYIDRIYIEKGETDEEPITIRLVISNHSKKAIGYGVLIQGRFCDDEGNTIKGVTTGRALSLERRISNETLLCEFKYKYDRENNFTADEILKITKFKIIGITVVYYFDEEEKIEDNLRIIDDELNYVISPDAYQDDYNTYTANMSKAIGEYY